MDIEVCSECGGKLKVISSIEEPEVIKKILNHLGLESKPRELLPARGPPEEEEVFDFALEVVHTARKEDPRIFTG